MYLAKRMHSSPCATPRLAEPTCSPGNTALLIADSKSTPRMGSFLKKIMPPLGPLRDCKQFEVFSG